MIRKIMALFTMAAMALFSSCSKSETEYNDMTITFFDFGKADGIVITTPESTVIIDCGERGDGKEILSFLEEKEITRVDMLIISHYDKDHVGGAAKVINNIEIGEVLAPDYTEESDETAKYEKALNNKSITPQLVTSDIYFSLDGVDYTVYAPKENFYGEDDDNDFSLVVKAMHGDNTMLFTGDAMEQRLDEIMDIGKCTFLKVPYHGRKISNLGDFLDRTSPECAVVCTSESEFSSDTQKELKKHNISYYSTCFNGRITAVSNGHKISIETEK